MAVNNYLTALHNLDDLLSFNGDPDRCGLYHDDDFHGTYQRDNGSPMLWRVVVRQDLY